jgi:hypothetical protein
VRKPYCSCTCRPINGSGRSLLTRTLHQALPTVTQNRASGKSSSWLVAVRHFRHAVAGRPGPMSTRGALATMPVPSSALSATGPCAPGRQRHRDSRNGSCFLAPHSVRGRGRFVFHSPGPVCGNGPRLRETAHVMCDFRAVRSSTTPQRGVEGKFHAATQDHPLRR